MKRSHLHLFVFIVFAAIAVSCHKDPEKPHRAWSFFPNMHDQVSVRAQESDAENYPGLTEHKSAMRKPIEGTVPTGFVSYETAKMDIEAAGRDVNPLPMTSEILKSGRRAFNIYCTPCHGPRGAGDGPIIPSSIAGELNSGHVTNSQMQMMRPPPLASESVKTKSDGHLFNILSRGSAIMPSYGRLPVEMRWSIVHYLRVLYKAENPSSEELETFKKNKEMLKDPSASDVVNNWRKLKK